MLVALQPRHQPGTLIAKNALSDGGHVEVAEVHVDVRLAGVALADVRRLDRQALDAALLDEGIPIGLPETALNFACGLGAAWMIPTCFAIW